MRAKVIKTGEIVNVVPTEGGWVADFGNYARHYTDSELDFDFEFADWEKFRREVAKDILAGMYSNPYYDDMDYGRMAWMAVLQADELIKRLKGDKK